MIRKAVHCAKSKDQPLVVHRSDVAILEGIRNLLREEHGIVLAKFERDLDHRVNPEYVAYDVFFRAHSAV